MTELSTNLSLIFLRIYFMKKTSMPIPVVSLGYHKSYSTGSPNPIKIPSNSMWLTEKTWHHTGNQKKKLHFLMWSTSLLLFFKDLFINHRQKTNRAVVFSILTSSYHFLMQGLQMRPFNTLENKIPSEKLRRVQLIWMKVQAHSSL